MALVNPSEMDTWWCCYCVCEGFGLSSIGSPLCKQDSKMLCIKATGSGDCVSIAGPDGLCLANQKYCCLSQAMQCIPTAPFIEICGKRVWGAGTAKPFPSASSMKPPMPPPSGGSFGNPIFTLETCQKDLAEAIANEDFLLAHELKKRRAVLLEAGEKSIPVSIQMA